MHSVPVESSMKFHIIIANILLYLNDGMCKMNFYGGKGLWEIICKPVCGLLEMRNFFFDRSDFFMRNFADGELFICEPNEFRKSVLNFRVKN